MNFNFLSHLVASDADSGAQSLVDVLVSKNPKGAEAAELATMRDELNALTKRLALARADFDKEKAVFDGKSAMQTQRLAAAQILNGKYQAETDPNKKADLEKKLSSYLDLVESSKKELEAEQADFDQAHNVLTACESAVKTKADQIHAAEQAMKSAEREVALSQHRREAAESAAKTAEELSGLTADHSHLNAALESLQRTAAKNNATASALQTKAEALKPTSLETDPDIAAAEAAAAGKSTAPRSLEERMAALK